MQLRLLLCALVSASARLALSVDSHTTLVVTPERVYGAPTKKVVKRGQSLKLNADTTAKI